MSYRIEYRQLAVRIPAATLGKHASLPHPDRDRFVVLVEGGDNNLYDRDGRRVRSWGVQWLGTHDQVMKMVVRFAGDCEGGMLKPLGSDARPEQYIARIRRLLDAAVTHDPAMSLWQPRVKVAADHPMVGHLLSAGVHVDREKEYGSVVAVATLAEDQLPVYFELIEPYIEKTAAWALAQPRTYAVEAAIDMRRTA